MGAKRGPRERPARAPRARRWILLSGALALAAALFGITRWQGPHAPPSRGAPAHSGPAAGLSLAEAAAEAARLSRADRAYESLPYYRRVSPEIPPGRVDFRLEFATALQNASLQAHIQSADRVGLMLESLDQLGRAERAAADPGVRARVMVARAFSLRVWGFAADALAELHRALATDPSHPELAETAHLMELRLRDPTLSLEALERATGTDR